MRVLLIEDNRELAQLYQEQFEGAGWRVRHAPTGEEGLLLARRFHPDVVVLDLFLPGAHGLEVLQELKNSPTLKATPVMVLSGRLGPEETQAAQALGAARILHKTLVTPGEIVHQATKLARKRRKNIQIS